MNNNNLHNHSQVRNENIKLLSMQRANELEKQLENHESELPFGYFFDDEKLMHLPSTDKKPNIYICSKLEVIAYIRDDNNENYGKLLVFKDPEKHPHKWAIPMELIAGDGAKYRAALLSRGLEISPKREAQILLSAYIINSQPTLWIRCVRHLGWYKNNFISPQLIIGNQNDEQLIFQNPNITPPSYAQKGTLKEWIDNIARLCNKNSRLELAISASFGSPLLHLLKAEGGGIHFRGHSSLGKSKILRAAGSVWGDESFVQRWNATINGLEAIASGYNDSLLCLDEISQIDPSVSGETAYLLANEKGKLRANKTGNGCEQQRWKFFFLSNGEISLEEHMKQCGKQSKGGQEIRMMDIPADTGKYGCFENLHEYATGEEFADALSEACDNFYGTVSIAYLNKIIENQEFAIGFVEKIQKSFIDKNRPLKGSGQVARALKRLAIMAAGGELATEYGFTGWEKGAAIEGISKCFNDWLIARGGNQNIEKIRALKHVRNFFVSNPQKFLNWDCVINKELAEESSFKKYDRQGNIEFFVHRDLFRKEICLGLNEKTVAACCVEDGWIIPDAEENPTRSEIVSIHKIKDRYYRFTSKVMESKFP